MLESRDRQRGGRDLVGDYFTTLLRASASIFPVLADDRYRTAALSSTRSRKRLLDTAPRIAGVPIS